MSFYDMHCHLDFASNAARAAREIEALGTGAFAVSVLPGDEQGTGFCSNFVSKSGAAASSLGFEQKPVPFSPVKWGVGLHPWWVADGRAGAADVEAAVAAVETNRFVGEVGLDFGKTHGTNPEGQKSAFRHIARAAAQAGGRLLSIHSVRAAAEVFAILEEEHTLDTCTCIFHWYSDSADMLQRALASGCYFSVGKLMLQSKRGREYARQIPSHCLLFETDEPAQGAPYDVSDVQQQLAETCAQIAELKAMDATELATEVAATSQHLLDL